MHKLGRKVRFSINPFLPQYGRGANSFSSEPAGEGLSIFFELFVALVGKVDPATGFITNVVDVDKAVRQYVVPVFARQIREYFQQGRHVGFPELAKLLKSAKEQLTGRFGSAKVGELNLALNPFRKVAIDCESATEDCKMIYFSEKFEFAAMHKLWNDDFTPQQNFEVFGKCANPTGHGHNYVIEVTVKADAKTNGFTIGRFQKVIQEKLINVIDHKNLNADVPHFAKVIPTVENIAIFAWDGIVDKFDKATLYCVTVWETDKTCCFYYGQPN